MKKTLFTATLLAASLMAASTVQAAPQEVTMWHYFDQKPEQEMLADMVEEYNSLQDDIHINATFVSRTELMNQYTVGALSGELPDIGQVDSPDMESYISLGVFEDITDELESWGELDQFYDGPLSSCKDPDGKVYGLPQNSNCLALACNMDLLKAAGYDHMPQSLDEFKEMVAATTDASNDVYGFAMCAVSTEEGTFQILPWLRSVQNGTGVNVDNITADSAVNGLQTLGDFVANGYMSKECVNWTQADAWNQFCAGKAAFAECGTWHLAQTDAINGAFEYDFTLLPTGDEGTSTSTIGGENFGVCKGSENKEACAKFLEWLCSQENEAKWAAVGGKIPTRQDATAEYTFEQDGFKVFTDEMNYAQARGPHAEWPSISEAVYTATQSVIVAREYKRRNLPISVIVVDFFHWPMQGEWKFDPTYWPDPDAMIKELKDMGIELMVSIWPTVDYRSENFNEMKSKGLLIRVDSGYPISMDFQGNTLHYDATNPEAREYVWEKAKKNYYDKGVKVFWLDEAEPEYTVYDFENYRYHLGPDIQVGNIYPVMYAKTFFDGMKAEGQENIINLLRCAWAGSQKYGALVWSGDIKSSFPSMKNQVAAGLNMGIAGIPWWTTDIGGFFGANINDPEFHELLIRWFEYGCFCPVMRLHGYRWPLQPQYGTTGGATCVSGAPNEVWSYTDQVCEILSDYLRLRERMLPYITELMEEAHEKGTPVMRPLFYDFPEDKESWNVETEYMFGPKVLVKPITDADARETDVYLPGGASWTNAWTGETFEGGQKVHVAAPIEQIPLFTRDGYKLPMK